MKLKAKFLGLVLPVLLFPILLFVGCQTTGGGQTQAPAQAYIPKQGVTKVFLTANAAPQGVGNVRRVYVFPPLLIDANGRPLGDLSYVVNEEGQLFWRSEAPDALGVKKSLESHFRDMGYRPVSFETLSNVETDHSILVVSPYFSAPLRDNQNPDNPFVFARIVMATYPASLSPQERLELVNQETLSHYHPKDNYILVVKRSLQHAISYMGMDRDWSQELSLQP
ncbi:hypothetical protein G0Q06_06490 [Puniceicoccales bacterium CK1056]|uniref:Lipoprotein n=1 Tax=Oceanipulchritudo coccoides TaxID=2706888 RepID=A0A6B2M1K2_9BACT|nr:hypothetical protein [Oceanipulchritudo coccoides]NDV62089.1 hypothetical protein [Oceanipulchritudo coccoides]